MRCVIAFTLVAAALFPIGDAAADASSTRADTLAQARAALRRGDYVRAEHGFRAEGARGSAGAWVGLARVQLDTGRYLEAEASALEAGKTPSHRVASATLRGEALEARGLLDEAEAAYRSVTEVEGAHRARVRLGRLLQLRGKADAAEPFLHALVDAYNEDSLGPRRGAGLAYVAMAVRALGGTHEANDAFREAALADRGRVETQIEWARLFFDKYDLLHAGESIEEALATNPNHPEALALMARVHLQQSFDFAKASELLDRALGINPNLVLAHVTRATIALRAMDLDEADAHLARALAIDPNDLEALSVRAAVRFLADDADGFEQAKRDVLARNPRFSRMYSIIARYAEWEHRYTELVDMAREALRIDPDDASAFATLGTNLLRAGAEEEGLAALHEAWKRDRFNVFVYNTLNLYDEVVSKHYVEFDATPFVVRTHVEERAILEPYLVPMLRRAYGDMRERYGFTPHGPLHVELYADRQHFSVRTTGLPNVGVQGVCFGKVVTAISPRAGPYNWGQITWHELAHVFHLQLSKNHVPRWFTEGLAEYETTIARPEWKREEDRELWEALRSGSVHPLSRLNAAFTDARRPEDLMTAYYLSWVAVDYLVGRFGFDRVPSMLAAWGRGLPTAEVFRSVLGVGAEALDADFRAHVERRVAAFDRQFFIDFSEFADASALERTVAARPEDPDALAALAAGSLLRNDYAGAERWGLAAIRRAPNHALGHFILTRVALEKGDIARAERCLRAIVAGGLDGHVLRLLLARAALADHRPQDALREAEAAAKLDPGAIEPWRVLLDIAEQTGNAAIARRALEQIVALDQHDRTSHLALMAILARDEDAAALVRVGESTMYLDPESPHVHKLLGDGYLRTGAPERALFEYDRALALDHRKPGSVELGRARALFRLGRHAAARKAVDAAVRADASLAAEAARASRGE